MRGGVARARLPWRIVILTIVAIVEHTLSFAQPRRRDAPAARTTRRSERGDAMVASLRTGDTGRERGDARRSGARPPFVAHRHSDHRRAVLRATATARRSGRADDEAKRTRRRNRREFHAACSLVTRGAQRCENCAGGSSALQLHTVVFEMGFFGTRSFRLNS